MSVFGFAISVTGPIFIVVLLGFILRRRGTIDADFVLTASNLVYRFGIPAILFLAVYEGDDTGQSSPWLSVYLLAVTGVMLALAYAHARLTRIDPGSVKEFVQGVFRSNLAVVSLAFCANTYGDAGLAQAAVPMGILTILYNLLAVLILGVPSSRPGERRALASLRSVATNPLILALVAGFVCRAASLPLPGVIADAGRYFANMTLPLALFCIGASLDLSAMRAERGTMLAACTYKLVLTPLVFTLGALALGWRGQTLGIVFFFGAAPTAAASFIMVKAMRGNDKLAAGIVVFTTVACMATVTIGLFVLRAFDLV